MKPVVWGAAEVAGILSPSEKEKQLKITEMLKNSYTAFIMTYHQYS